VLNANSGKARSVRRALFRPRPLRRLAPQLQACGAGMGFIVDYEGRINYEELVKLILSRPVQYIVIEAAAEVHTRAQPNPGPPPSPLDAALLFRRADEDRSLLDRRCTTLEAALQLAVDTANSLKVALETPPTGVSGAPQAAVHRAPAQPAAATAAAAAATSETVEKGKTEKMEKKENRVRFEDQVEFERLAYELPANFVFDFRKHGAIAGKRTGGKEEEEEEEEDWWCDDEAEQVYYEEMAYFDALQNESERHEMLEMDEKHEEAVRYFCDYRKHEVHEMRERHGRHEEGKEQPRAAQPEHEPASTSRRAAGRVRRKRSRRRRRNRGTRRSGARRAERSPSASSRITSTRRRRRGLTLSRRKSTRWTRRSR